MTMRAPTTTAPDESVIFPDSVAPVT
jgi:hypothetical protein